MSALQVDAYQPFHVLVCRSGQYLFDVPKHLTGLVAPYPPSINNEKIKNYLFISCSNAVMQSDDDIISRYSSYFAPHQWLSPSVYTINCCLSDLPKQSITYSGRVHLPLRYSHSWEGDARLLRLCCARPLFRSAGMHNNWIRCDIQPLFEKWWFFIYILFFKAFFFYYSFGKPGTLINLLVSVNDDVPFILRVLGIVSLLYDMALRFSLNFTIWYWKNGELRYFRNIF